MARKRLTKKEKNFIKKNYKVLLIIFVIFVVIGIISYYFINNNDKENSNNNKQNNNQEIVLGDELNVIAIEMRGTYGDSFIIKYHDYEILVDAGTKDDKEYVQAALEEFVTDKKIELLVLTHLHADHIGAMTTPTFFSSINMTVDKIVDAGTSPTSQTATNYVSMRSSLVSSGAKYYPYYTVINDSSVGRIWTIDSEAGIYIEFFDTGAVPEINGSCSELNESSVAFVLNYQNNKWFFAGDLPSSCEADLIDSMKESKTEYFTESNYVVYKSCHHGSKTSNGDALLSYVKPDMIFIMAGIIGTNQTNTKLVDQHPFLETLNRMKKYTENIYWSSINGLSVFKSSGDTVTATFRGRTVDYYYNGSIVSRDDEKDITIFNSKWYKIISGK